MFSFLFFSVFSFPFECYSQVIPRFQARHDLIGIINKLCFCFRCDLCERRVTRGSIDYVSRAHSAKHVLARLLFPFFFSLLFSCLSFARHARCVAPLRRAVAATTRSGMERTGPRVFGSPFREINPWRGYERVRRITQYKRRPFESGLGINRALSDNP